MKVTIIIYNHFMMCNDLRILVLYKTILLLYLNHRTLCSKTTMHIISFIEPGHNIVLNISFDHGIIGLLDFVDRSSLLVPSIEAGVPLQLPIQFKEDCCERPWWGGRMVHHCCVAVISCIAGVEEGSSEFGD